ncbi:hypothetical protein ACA910_004720 [Epithemia clementina (nom. ined.)]
MDFFIRQYDLEWSSAGLKVFGLGSGGGARHYVMKLKHFQAPQQRPESHHHESFDIPPPPPPCRVDIPPIASLVLEDMPSSPQMMKHYYKKERQTRLVQDSWNATMDDHTLETVNTDEEDEDETSSSSLSISPTVVSFADPLVTQIVYRPLVETEEQRVALWYGEDDYAEFRRAFVRQQQRVWFKQQQQQQQQQGPCCRRRRVSFPAHPVTAVHEYPCQYHHPDEKNLLFYSEHDLERFLDDFVASLNEVLVVAEVPSPSEESH